MATVTVLHFSKGSSCTSPGGFVDSEPRSFQSRRIPNSRNQITAYKGLRSENIVDSLRLQSNAKATSTQAKRATRRPSRRPLAVVVCGKGMNLVFVGAEMAPWSKTGGLGDVLGGLPPAMAANGHRVMTIAPRYDQYKDGWDTSVQVELKVGNRVETVRFFHCYKRGVDRVFVDHPMFLAKVWGKTGGKIYGPATGTDYEDNQQRFSLFCQAALEAPRVLHLNNSEYYSGPYGEDVLFIANDWHTGLLPCYLKSMYRSRGIYRNAKVALCIHNIVYQGRFASSDFALLNLPDEFKSSLGFTDGYDKPVKGRKINWMKAGIIESDRVVTVSPHYALELVGEETGVELDHVLRMTGVTGIVNGMDGTGKKKLERQLAELEDMFPDKLRAHLKFNVPLAHAIMGGADLLAVTSRFEPCGLIQLQGMRYGVPAVCSTTGGLVDTVKEGITGFHMGRFSANCNVVDKEDIEKVVKTVKRAIKDYYGTPAFAQMIQNCMKQDLSWKGPAKKWEQFLMSLGATGSEPGIDGEEIAPLAMENMATP
ncbi:hypothetical protein C4D60_Mb09t21060 [Musa balbisiana]|uniref:NDP-glucose--starch glucosyltransferase n=1 Tax=Musa balbisiana TaxID=52838 RepID=A0A4S8IHX7_MUSBA|nr:hypothetical protein C4D60_Mb09t21060 [Musa balbisiana]